MSQAPLLAAFQQAFSEAWASGAGLLLPLGFFAGTAVLVPFSVGSESDLLARIGPGILWLALALASFVTLERIFQADLQDGALDLWVQEETSISMIAGGKDARTLARLGSAPRPVDPASGAHAASPA